jgi:Putative lumazine-binding
MTTTMTVADEVASFAAYEGIAATLQQYIDGARGGDSILMRHAFIDAASIRGSYGGNPVDWTQQAFCELIDKGGPGAAGAEQLLAAAGQVGVDGHS